MILVGDIGATKTVLALFSKEDGVAGGAIHETRFESNKFSSLEAVIVEFLHETKARPMAASFGVAGPVKDGKAQITNLPWIISAESISSSFDIEDVFLLNDLESIATAIPYLGADQLYTINQGNVAARANIAVIAPGTGLGIAFLVWAGTGYKACASEGGHTAFSPRNPQEVELLKYLQRRYDHVSFERICSGGQLPNIYDFCKEQGSYPEPVWLATALKQAPDRTPVIVQAALELKADICEATLDIFVHTLGTVIGNMAVTLLPKGGIYLGGGIPPRILTRLQQPDFLSAISDKGRFSELSSTMPIHVIMEPRSALHGAAWSGLDAMQSS